MRGKKWIAFILLGISLLTEHYYTYRRFDPELIGHETFGLFLIIFSFLRLWWLNLSDYDWTWDTKTREDEEERKEQ